MNELFILGELMEEPQTGYQLRNALQGSLGRHRKVSFGTLYPLLDKLEEQGFIEFVLDQEGRNKKTAIITEKGKKRFYELMYQDVPDGAHNFDIYMIKLDAMQHIPIDEQLNLLIRFEREQQAVVDETVESIACLRNEERIDHWYAQRKLALRLRHAEESISWAKDFINYLKNKGE